MSIDIVKSSIFRALPAVLYFYLFDSSFIIVGVVLLLTNPINIFFNSRKRPNENPWLQPKVILYQSRLRFYQNF